MIDEEFLLRVIGNSASNSNVEDPTTRLEASHPCPRVSQSFDARMDPAFLEGSSRSRPSEVVVGKRRRAEEDVEGLEVVMKKKKDNGKVVEDIFEEIDSKQVALYKELASLVEEEDIIKLKSIIKSLRSVLDEAEEKLKNNLL